MATITVGSVPYLNLDQPMTDQSGKVTYGFWSNFFQQLLVLLQGIVQAVNNNISGGSASFNIATQPTLAVADAGFVGRETDTGHLVTWDGTKWGLLQGDVGNGFIRNFIQDPQETGWVLCNGASTTRLQVGGATLALSAPFTLPDFTGGAFAKEAIAYGGPAIAPSTGTMAAAGAHNHTGNSGVTAPGTDVQGSHNHTGATGLHQHPQNFSANVIVPSGGGTAALGGGALPGAAIVTHNTDDATASISTDGAHSHTVNGHQHTISTDGSHTHVLNNDIAPASVAFKTYYRR